MSEKNNIDKKLSTIKNLLAKQNLVENLIHKQEMTRQDIVQSLVQKQNSSELEKLIKKLEIQEVARILEALLDQERIVVWNHVESDRRDDVLLEVSDDIRMDLRSEEHTSELQSH